MPKAHTQSQINEMLKSGEAKQGPLRTTVTSVKTGKIISNEIVQSTTLPTAIVTKSDIYFIYNDIDIQQFKNEVRNQTSMILQALRNTEFSNAGVQYQQFLDQFAALMELPTDDHLNLVRSKGIDLYATLENEFVAAAGEIHPVNNPGQDLEKRFYAVAEANLNLFVHMIIINLAKFNRLDDVQGQLREKIALFRSKLKTLLNNHIFAGSDGTSISSGKNVDEWRTLYGWLLLKENDLATAMEIYDNDENIKSQITFPKLFRDVMSVLSSQCSRSSTHSEIIMETFGFRGVPKSRIRIARQIAYYLQQCDQVSSYLDELVSETKDWSDTTMEPTLDIRSLIIHPAADNLVS
ncbi:hypothetical protein SLIQ_06435 [Serratia liquefaciens FK01]|nr:hypothetical protein SLIQ_06435 [Serratia liquefaciens FK01]